MNNGMGSLQMSLPNCFPEMERTEVEKIGRKRYGRYRKSKGKCLKRDRIQQTREDKREKKVA